MKRLNRKGYLTIEIILGATIAFAIAFFLMEITTKMVSDTEDTYRDTEVATDSALIISGVKDQIENRVNDNGGNLKITSISCDNNVCIIKYNDNNDGELSIDGSKVVFKVNNVVQYSKQLDDSLTDIKLISSFNSEINDDNKSNVYFKVTGKNIFLDKDYSIVIPIDNMEIVEPEKPKEPDFEDPNDPPSEPEDPNSLVISCPTENPPEGNLPSLYTEAKYPNVNREPWTNTYGTGKVSITVTATGGKIVKVYYFNYSTYQDNYVNSPIVLKNDQDAPTDASATFKVTDAKTNTIKVFAVDTNNNTVSKECVTNVDTIVPYTPTIHLMKDTTGFYSDFDYYHTYLSIVSNTCCVVTLGIGERVCENITTTDTSDTECYIKYSTSSEDGFRGWCDDKLGNTKRDGLSEWYSYKWVFYKNNTYVGTCDSKLSKSLTDTKWINTGTGCSGNVSYDKMEFTATDAAGNKSPKLTFYKR